MGRTYSYFSDFGVSICSDLAGVEGSRPEAADLARAAVSKTAVSKAEADSRGSRTAFRAGSEAATTDSGVKVEQEDKRG